MIVKEGLIPIKYLFYFVLKILYCTLKKDSPLLQYHLTKARNPKKGIKFTVSEM